MQQAARAAARSVPVVVAGAAAAATAPSTVAHADAVALDTPLRRITDGWELADVQDKNVVLFSAADIDNAVAVLTRPQPGGPFDELRDDSDVSSDGSVDALIERSSSNTLGGSSLFGPALGQDADATLARTAGASGAGSVVFGMDAELLSVAARLLKSPGVQREICSAALSDPEVFDILASKMDLPAYLEGQGFAARGLLQGPGAAAPSSSVQAPARGAGATAAAADYDDAGGDGSPLDATLGWAADRVEDLGFAVVRLGEWIRRQVSGRQAGGAADAAGVGAGGGDARARARRVGEAVVVACVAIVCVLLLRRAK